MVLIEVGQRVVHEDGSVDVLLYQNIDGAFAVRAVFEAIALAVLQAGARLGMLVLHLV